MLTIKSPETYLNEYHILRDAGKYISVYGKKAYVIAGKTAWDRVQQELTTSLEEWRIEFSLQIMEGYPTYEKVEKYASAAYQDRAELVIGIGGGKVCDVAKAVGNFRNLPIVMIPTIPATCACWAARSILYKEDGDFDFIQWNQKNSRLILADTHVLRESPKRYLASGIMDTFAKWYEFEPLIKNHQSDVVLRQDVAIAKVAFDLLKELGPAAMKGEIGEDGFRQVVDAILFLAGATGSFANGKAYRGLAHPYYFISTRIPESRHLLHGEKVAFGLLVQFILARKDKTFIGEYLKDLALYRQLDIPEEWNVSDPDESILKISELLLKEWPVIVENGFAASAEDVQRAIHEACRLIREVR
ncbi:MAG: iron-containing alcohol dehydrogenase family protein [Lachnospiraceae bacterium]|nr:iron-containing alcohol dehydrogenase family protein [Lachnospiraceae bacterium]